MKHGSQSLSIRERQRSAREQFFQGDTPLQFGLDPAVIRGWQRSLALGIEPDREVVFQAVHLNRMRAAMEASRRMLVAAESELDQLARTLVPSGASVLLSDASLVVVGVRGHRDTMPPELRISSREGIDLSEQQVGSNAPSIAAAECAPSVVLNNAHYCTVNAIFACAAAPIRAPGGALLGTIDVTTCHRPLPAEAPFLVTAAAKAIENAMFDALPDGFLIRMHPRADFIGTPLEAVISVDGAGEVVGANESALGMLGLRWPLRGVPFDRLFRESFADVLSQAGRLDRFGIALSTVGGLPVHAQVTMPARSRPTPMRGGAEPMAQAPSRAAERPAGAAAAKVDARAPAPVDAAAGDRLTALAGGDAALVTQWRLAAGALARRVPVVLQGESGCGRKTLARALHDALPAAGPFETLHCVDASESDFDAALAAAAGGTLVLDEVTMLPVTLQARLQRLLQQAESHAPEALRVPRLITVTERDLRDGCEAGRFRYDLCNRLKGLRVEVPALHRRVDLRACILAVLADERARAGLGGDPAAALAREALDLLAGHRWPGNFRELVWLLRAAVAAAGDRPIGPADLPHELTQSARYRGAEAGGPHPGEAAGAVDLGAEPLRVLQDRAIRQALDKHRGNLSSAARELGISRGTLYRRLRALGIRVDAGEKAESAGEKAESV